jgi:uncharacterized protein DUF1524
VRPNRRLLKVAMALVVAMFVLNAAPTLLERFGADVRPVDVDDAPTEVLAGLPIAPESGAAGYSRDQFGAGWVTGPDGCDTRARVLRDEAVVITATDGCAVVAGEWVSAWDAQAVTDPAGLDIDHLVPLAEAWASGADQWPAGDREAFANDLDSARPDALVAVTATTNRSKGDRDPAEWLPPERAVRCRYVTAWVTQKAAWGLSVDPAEHQALTRLLADCPEAGQ